MLPLPKYQSAGINTQLKHDSKFVIVIYAKFNRFFRFG